MVAPLSDGYSGHPGSGATEIGPATAAHVTGRLGEQALHRLRSARGVIRLADTYGAHRLELTGALALEVGEHCYRTVKVNRPTLRPRQGGKLAGGVEQGRRNPRDRVGNCLTLEVGNSLTFDTPRGAPE